MSEVNTNAVQNEVQAETVKLSRPEKLRLKIAQTEARIQRDTEALAELQGELQGIERLASVAPGTAVTVRLGRGETTREVNAVVVGVKADEDSATRYKVQYGEGFDADVAVVFSTQIIAVL